MRHISFPCYKSFLILVTSNSPEGHSPCLVTLNHFKGWSLIYVSSILVRTKSKKRPNPLKKVKVEGIWRIILCTFRTRNFKKLKEIFMVFMFFRGRGIYLNFWKIVDDCFKILGILRGRPYSHVPRSTLFKTLMIL